MAADALGPPRAPRPCWAVIRRFGRGPRCPAARDPRPVTRFAFGPLGRRARRSGGRRPRAVGPPSAWRAAGETPAGDGATDVSTIVIRADRWRGAAAGGGVVHLCGGLQYGAGPWIAVRRSLKGNYHSDARYMGTLVRSLSYSMLMASSVITTRERRFQQALESAALDELLQARAASQAKRLVSGRFTVRVATDRSAIYKDSWH